jgi:hypothetical protein
MRVKKRAGREKEDVVLMRDRLLKKNYGEELWSAARRGNADQVWESHRTQGSIFALASQPSPGYFAFRAMEEGVMAPRNDSR